MAYTFIIWYHSAEINCPVLPGETIMKKKVTLVRKPRTRSLFNTGTRPHKSKKDYT